LAWKTAELIAFVKERFERLADPDKAVPMAAYMKTSMPFYGIQKPDRVPVYREMKKVFPPANQPQYEEAIFALWNLPHRENKYLAIEFARQHKAFVNATSFPIYERLIREGAWWDLVDDVAVSIVTDCYLAERAQICPIIDTWIDDKDLWIRRTAILAHNHHEKDTDAKQLFAHVLRRSDEQEFFIRKAIGWALREYSYAEPENVMSFLASNKAKLSPLSYREAAKGLIRGGHLCSAAAHEK
jgi:3-methyladenine DNA glycosylase AlkD